MTLTGDDIGDLLGELQALRVDVGDDDMARADMARDRGGHDADRPGAGDQHVLADKIEGERGVDGVAERIEDRADLVVDASGSGTMLKAGMFTYSAKAPGRLTPMPWVSGSRWIAPAARGAALHADDVALARDALADLEAA